MSGGPVGGGRDGQGRGAPSPWVERFLPLLPPGARVLDVAAGGGRHTALLLARGLRVTAVDRDVSGLEDLAGEPGLTRVREDLEAGGVPGVLAAGLTWDGVVVTHYLHRPLLPHLFGALAPGGLLLYETFMRGHAERFGKPSRPDFLLAEGELLAHAREAGLQVLAFEQGEVATPRPAVLQRLAAVRAAPPLLLPRENPLSPQRRGSG